MSRMPDCQGRKRPPFPRFDGVSENVVKPLAGTRSELALTIWSANYTSEHCELPNSSREIGERTRDVDRDAIQTSDMGNEDCSK